MLAGHFKLMCDYNYWAHHQLWDGVLQLSEEQFRTPNTCFTISVHEQVLNTLGSEWLWMARLRGISPTTRLTPAMLPDRDTIRVKWVEVEAEVRAYVDHIRESQLSEVITYTTTFGEPQRNARWEILTHMFNYSTDHRSRVVAMLKPLGVDIPELDLLAYFRANKQIQRQIAMDHFHKSASI